MAGVLDFIKAYWDVGLVALCVFIAAGAVFFTLVRIISSIIRKSRRKLVEKQSVRLFALPLLNEEYSFYDIDSAHIEHLCRSKRDIETLDAEQFLTDVASEDPNWLTELCDRTAANRDEARRYFSDCGALMTASPEKIEKRFPVPLPMQDLYPKYRRNLRKRWYAKLERDLCAEKRLHPATDFTVTLDFGYVSPGGRNAYRRTESFNFGDCREILDAVETRSEYRQSRQYQRSIVTNSLRYDVMKRDGFRCVLCGASAEDGALLHVDHIIPIARGGTSEMDNLRTLCDACNSGKKDKYDEYGLN